jgi:hypothetical protein
MKNVMAGLLTGVALAATAQTVILYDDGSQYTVADNEKVYVSDYSRLFKKRENSHGTITLTSVYPNADRDYVPVETGAEGAVGSNQWCESYEPWSEGLTFDMIAWQRSCDVNGDGEYNICDWYEPTGIATFEELEWRDKCNDGKPWDGS